MRKDELIKSIDKMYPRNSKKIIKNQIELFNNLKDLKIKKKSYK